MNNDKIYTKLYEKYGDEQIIVAIEEFSELQKELCKFLRNKLNMENLIEEIADAEIMIEQIKLHFKIPQENIDATKKEKLKRTVKRLLDE